MGLRGLSGGDEITPLSGIQRVWMNYYIVFEVFGNRAQDIGIVQFSGLILNSHTMLEGNVDGALLLAVRMVDVIW
jgi:hypothetical protein